MSTKQKSWIGRFSWAAGSDYILITLGALLQAVSIRLFLVPGHLLNGGISGLAQLINFYTHFPIGVMILIGNIPLLILGWHHLGGRAMNRFNRLQPHAEERPQDASRSMWPALWPRPSRRRVPCLLRVRVEAGRR